MPVCTSSIASRVAVLGGDGAGRGQVARRRHDHAALALDGLEDHHRGRGSHGRGQRGDVAVRDVRDLARQRPERVGLGRLPGQRQGTHGSAVKAARGGDDLGPAGAPGQLEGGLVRLGAGVGEEHPTGAPGQGQQLLGQRHRRLGDVEVAHVAEHADLPGHRGHHGRMGVTQGIDRETRQHVQVGVSVLVPHHGAIPAYQRQRRRAVVVHQRRRPPPHEIAGIAAQ